MKTLSAAVTVALSFGSIAPASATLTPSIPRGEQTVQHSVAGGQPEICVIPTHLSNAKYSEKDLELEARLCSFKRGVNVAICPKTASTNPGVEFFLLPEGMTSDALEAKNCFIAEPTDKTDNSVKKVAKYKQSTSCSYTPSILGYYHMSRLLGGAGNVPVAVLRTFDLDQHKAIAEKGMSVSAKLHGTAALIYQTWSGLLSALKAGAGSKKKDVLFTDAIDQTYGALQLNPSGEAKYSAMFTPGKGSETRAAAFGARNAIFAKVKDPSAASQLVGRTFNAANLQAIQQMKDASDMVLLDTMLNQQDRFGNIHSVVMYAYVNGTEMKYSNKLKEEEKARGAIPVNVMMMKDNDCGVAKANLARQAGLLNQVAHMDPNTYKRLLELNRNADSPEVVRAFKQGMMFTSADWVGTSSSPGLRTLINEAATSLQKRCRAGSLKLDLDIAAHFSGAPIQQNCEI